MRQGQAMVATAVALAEATVEAVMPGAMEAAEETEVAGTDRFALRDRLTNLGLLQRRDDIKALSDDEGQPAPIRDTELNRVQFNLIASPGSWIVGAILVGADATGSAVKARAAACGDPVEPHDGVTADRPSRLFQPNRTVLRPIGVESFDRRFLRSRWSRCRKCASSAAPLLEPLRSEPSRLVHPTHVCST